MQRVHRQHDAIPRFYADHIDNIFGDRYDEACFRDVLLFEFFAYLSPNAQKNPRRSYSTGRSWFITNVRKFHQQARRRSCFHIRFQEHNGSDSEIEAMLESSFGRLLGSGWINLMVSAVRDPDALIRQARPLSFFQS